MKPYGTVGVGGLWVLAGAWAFGMAPSGAASARLAHTLDVSAVRVPFVANEGQLSDGTVRFYAHTFGGTVCVTEDGAMVYRLLRRDRAKGSAAESVVLTETLLDAWSDGVRGMAPSETRVNCFVGRDPARWRAGLPAYERVSLGDIHDRIALELRARGRAVEKIFTVRPGGDPGEIRVRVTGAETLRVDESGGLLARTALGDARFTAPLAFQSAGGRRVDVPVRYVVCAAAGVYGFEVGAYDRTRDLVIDPLLASTFLGSSEFDCGNALALDKAGNVVVVGETTSSDFPGAGGAEGGGLIASDVFVAILSAELDSLLTYTTMGGTHADYGVSVALDGAGNVFVAGRTESPNFPIVGGYDALLKGAYPDAFVAKLGPNLNSFKASTFLAEPIGTSGPASRWTARRMST